MRILVYRKTFIKSFDKLPQGVQTRVIERFELFMNNLYEPILNNHALLGQYDGFRSINITGDYRVIFREEGESVVVYEIGTHAKLYGL